MLKAKILKHCLACFVTVCVGSGLTVKSQNIRDLTSETLKYENKTYDVEITNKNTEILVPEKLNYGDKICILEPSRTGKYGEKNFKKRLPIVVNNLKKRGFEVVVYNESFQTSLLGVGDGTEQIRADLFNKAVENPEIKAIFTFWGGYGSAHILDKINYEKFRENRKIFVGFSDETAIEMALFEKSGIVTFHGPMVGATLNYQEEKTFDNLFDILMNVKSEFELENIDDDSEFKLYKNNKNIVVEGEVIGGNLCLVQSLIGTPYEPDYENKILFFEEVDEYDYAIHRILWQLKLSGKLNKISGIIIGSLTHSSSKVSEDHLLNVCFDVLEKFDIPIIYNFHIENNKVFVTQNVVCDPNLKIV